MKYKIKITEILEKVIEVEAENQDEACDKVTELYENGEIDLAEDNFVTAEFELLGE